MRPGCSHSMAGGPFPARPQSRLRQQASPRKPLQKGKPQCPNVPCFPNTSTPRPIAGPSSRPVERLPAPWCWLHWPVASRRHRRPNPSAVPRTWCSSATPTSTSPGSARARPSGAISAAKAGTSRLTSLFGTASISASTSSTPPKAMAWEGPKPHWGTASRDGAARW